VIKNRFIPLDIAQLTLSRHLVHLVCFFVLLSVAGVMTVLSMTTMGFSGRAQMPRVSYATALDSFVIICFSFVFAVMIEYAAINCLDKMAMDMKKMLQERDTKKVRQRTVSYNFCPFARASVSLLFPFLPSFFTALFVLIFLSHSLSLFSLFSSYSCIESFLSTFISDVFASHSYTFILQTVHILSSQSVSCSVSTDTRRFVINRLSQVMSPHILTHSVPTDSFFADLWIHNCRLLQKGFFFFYSHSLVPPILTLNTPDLYQC
jgi:Neurotransmitter-gated ion-channel transmembrane region.